MLLKVPQTRCGSKSVSVLKTWATDYQLKLATNSTVKNRKLTRFICFKKPLWIYTPFFMSPVCCWFSDELLGAKELLQIQNSLSVLDVPNFCCRLRKAGCCKAHKILPDFVALRGKEIFTMHRKGSMAIVVSLITPVRGCRCWRLGMWQPREAGGGSCKERLR